MGFTKHDLDRISADMNKKNYRPSVAVIKAGPAMKKLTSDGTESDQVK